MQKPGTAKTVIDVIQAKAAAGVIRAVNHKLRQKILLLLATHGQLTVTEIYVKTKSEQSVISGHLGILRRVGIVAGTRVAKKKYYTLVDSRIDQINGLINSLANL
jgi:DNA-binding transcriptional ArsR family regulator